MFLMLPGLLFSPLENSGTQVIFHIFVCGNVDDCNPIHMYLVFKVIASSVLLLYAAIEEGAAYHVTTANGI
ncbi:MAG: hypothetical protein NVSMB27_32680 [Ktedonobacteraceae bacterium]